ncbi:hypothetical protein BDR03DRAFT_1012477 [Suillus americanus]|nr:hypothetical protein BDR03DRAFT_1012477 [Suillus americanus]
MSGKGTAKPKLDPDLNLAGSEAPKKGHRAGAAGYSIKEVECLLKEIKKCLPLGGQAWDAVAISYNEWAQSIYFKAGTIALDDLEWDNGASDIRSEIEVKDVVEISTGDDDEEPKSVKPKHTGPKKSVVKAFCANPLLEPGLQHPHTTAASEALSSLTSVFNPKVMKDRDESQLLQMVQFYQINTLQTELREAHL